MKEKSCQVGQGNLPRRDKISPEFLRMLGMWVEQQFEMREMIQEREWKA